MKASRHLPLAPLVRYVSARHEGSGSVYSHPRHGHVSTLAFVAYIGCERSTYYKWRSGGIPLHAADRLARDLGLHLLNLWPDAYDDIELEDVA